MNIQRLIFAVLMALIISPANSEATQQICYTGLGLFTHSQTDGETAHIVGFTNCNSACTPPGFNIKRAYIEFADKQLYAQALTASENGLAYNVAFKDDATAKGNFTHGYYTCKIISIWK